MNDEALGADCGDDRTRSGFILRWQDPNQAVFIPHSRGSKRLSHDRSRQTDAPPQTIREVGKFP